MTEQEEQFLIEQSEADLTPMQAYWIRVNAVAAELDPEAANMDDRATKVNPKHNGRFMKTSTKVIWITSIKVPGKNIIAGRVFSLPPYLAAERIATGTHRISTEAEIEGWHNEQAQRKADTAAQKAAAAAPAPTVTVSIPPETIREIRDNNKRQQQPTPTPVAA